MPATTDKVIAIVCSDLHLQPLPPIARSAEPSWWAAMARPLKQLRDLQERHQCPVLIAGDIFDRWTASPETINFALEQLPDGCHAVPGQHDLPHHDYNDRKRSAYWTLVAAGKVTDLESERRYHLSHNLMVTPFPWGAPLEGVERAELGCVQVALCHRYVWTDGCGYTGAPKDAKVGGVTKVLEHYDVAAFGDNHKAFETTQGGLTVFNCGGFMRRKIDERVMQPRVGLVHTDGRVTSRDLITTDAFIEADSRAAILAARADEHTQVALGAFLDDLNTLDGSGIDFVEAVERYIETNGVIGRIRRMAIAACEGK